MTTPAVNTDDYLSRLGDYLIHLHGDWAIYWSLFGKEEARVALLNERCGFLFAHVQGALLDRVILELAKLFDPYEMRQDRTVSLWGALRLVGLDLAPELNTLKHRLNPLLLQRHKRVAHNDQIISLRQMQLAGFSHQMIVNAIRQVEDFYNEVLRLHDGTEVGFEIIDEDTEGEILRTIELIATGNVATASARAFKNIDLREGYGKRGIRDHPDE